MARFRLEEEFLLPFLTLLLLSNFAVASEYRGRIATGGMSLPGATITATQAGKTVSAVSDRAGTYLFPDLQDGSWHIRIEMLGFAPMEGDVVVASSQSPAVWDMNMLSLNQALALTSNKVVLPTTQVQAPSTSKPADSSTAKQSSPDVPRPHEDDSQRPSDGLLEAVIAFAPC